MKKFLFINIFLILFLSCNDKVKALKSEPRKTASSKQQKYPKPTALNSIVSKEVFKWEAYQNINSFLERFSNITANQALINASELKDLSIKLKNSKTPLFLDQPSLKSRINILLNETFRLADMTLIASISNDEVEIQILKILEVFSSLNQKINTMYSQKQFEETIEEEKDSVIHINKPVAKTKNKKKSKKPITKRNFSLKKEKKNKTLKERLKLEKNE